MAALVQAVLNAAVILTDAALIGLAIGLGVALWKAGAWLWRRR